MRFLIAALYLALAAVIMAVTPSYGHDWTGSDDPEIAAWFSNIHRKDGFPCCGVADAYSIHILVEADPRRPEEQTGLAEIGDGRELTLMHGSVHRPSLPDGLQFRFKFAQISREVDGNPTSSAWAFLSVADRRGDGPNAINTVFCVVPLPPGV